jgi:hypothetical protein
VKLSSDSAKAGRDDVGARPMARGRSFGREITGVRGESARCAGVVWGLFDADERQSERKERGRDGNDVD